MLQGVASQVTMSRNSKLLRPGRTVVFHDAPGGGPRSALDMLFPLSCDLHVSCCADFASTNNTHMTAPEATKGGGGFPQF